MVILFLLFFIPLTRGEVFTALVDLTQSFNSKLQLGNNLLEFANEAKAHIQSLKAFTKSIHVTPENQNPETYINNPLKAYLLIQRLIRYWKEEFPILISTDENFDSIANRIQQLLNYLPNKDDLKGSIDALVRLQDTYKIKTHKIANGIITRNEKSNSLTSQQCFEIGLRSFEKDYFYFVEWASEAYYRINENVKSEKIKLLDYLSFGFFKQNNLRQALALTKEWRKIDPLNVRASENEIYFTQEQQNIRNSNSFFKGDIGDLFTDLAAINVRPSTHDRGNEFRTYEALCRGESTIKNPNLHSLKCRYYVPHYYFLLGPIKEETLFHKPRIVIYHDLINDNEIEGIKRLSINKLRRATVQNSITGKLEFANYRISKSAWLRTDVNELTERINLRIQLVTGINLETAEELQVVNYGIGGHYEPHFDFARKSEINSFESEIGNRLATLLFYMSDVEAGGATVFTKIGAKIWPKKGAAAFWWNLLPSGEGDLSTRHAACPVLLGSKWVMNKWFHERGQEFTRPCALNRNATKSTLNRFVN